jgi:hypothetical protein
MIAIQFAGEIYGSYALTIGGVIGYTIYTIRRGRQLAARVREEDRPWT